MRLQGIATDDKAIGDDLIVAGVPVGILQRAHGREFPDLHCGVQQVRYV